MEDFNAELCEARHKATEKEQENIKNLLKYMHEGDEKFLARELEIVANELEKIPELEERITNLEKWRIYLLGVIGAASFLIPFIFKAVTHLILGV